MGDGTRKRSQIVELWQMASTRTTPLLKGARSTSRSHRRSLVAN